MVRKRKKRKRKRDTQRWILYIITGIVIALIIAAALYYGQYRRPLSPVEEYFKISDLSAGSFRIKPNSTDIFLNELTFNFTAVGGDAHNVYVNTGRLAWADAVYLEDMMKGESRWVTLYFRTELGLPLKEDGWGPIRIQIRSLETGTGTITVYLPAPF